MALTHKLTCVNMKVQLFIIYAIEQTPERETEKLSLVAVYRFECQPNVFRFVPQL